MKRSRAFTLIEIMIALFIFALMASIVSTALYTMFNAREAAIQYADDLSELQTTITLLEFDIAQSLKRPQGKPFYGGDDTIYVLPHAGFSNPNDQLKRSTLSLVSYRVENHELIRSVYVGDKVTMEDGVKRVLLHNVSDIKINYINSANEILNQWPDSQNKLSKGNRLPKAIMITLSLKHWGKLPLIFNNPAGDRA